MHLDPAFNTTFRLWLETQPGPDGMFTPEIWEDWHLQMLQSPELVRQGGLCCRGRHPRMRMVAPAPHSQQGGVPQQTLRFRSQPPCATPQPTPENTLLRYAGGAGAGQEGHCGAGVRGEVAAGQPPAAGGGGGGQGHAGAVPALLLLGELGARTADGWWRTCVVCSDAPGWQLGWQQQTAYTCMSVKGCVRASAQLRRGCRMLLVYPLLSATPAFACPGAGGEPHLLI